jgi:5-methylcytosine-specific restriction endonuclease McrA
MPRAADDPRYHTARWRQTRARIISRDGPQCSIAGCQTDMTAKREIHVDHIIDVPRDAPSPQFYDETNLQILCKRHHFAKSLEVAAGTTEPQSPNW